MKMNDKWGLYHTPLTNQSFNGFNLAMVNDINNFSIYFLYFSELALNLFKWVDLPETMDGDYMERVLFRSGNIAVVYDDTMGFLNLEYTENGERDKYEYPIEISVTSANGKFFANYKNTDNNTSFIICKNTKLSIPTILYVDYFTDIISEIDLSAKVNVKMQKTPALCSCSKEQKLSLENALTKFDGNNPYIIVDEEFNEYVKLGVFSPNAPYVADKLIECKEKYKNEFLSFIGVNNVSTEKKERLITDEVNANNQLISLSFNAMYSQRKLFVERFNKIFADKIEKPIDCVPNVESLILNTDKGVTE